MYGANNGEIYHHGRGGTNELLGHAQLLVLLFLCMERAGDVVAWKRWRW